MEENTVEQVKVQAANLLKAANYQEAYRLYMLLLREEPDSDTVNLGLARAAQAIGEVNQAILALERLVDKYPRDALLRMALARAFVADNNPEAARRELEFAQSIDSSLSDQMLATAMQALTKERSPWQLAGRIGMGVVYDSNANMGPQSAFVQLGYWPLKLESSAVQQESWGAYTSANLDVARQIGKSAWWLAGDLGVYRKGYFKSLGSSRELFWGRAALGLRRIGSRSLFDLRVKNDLVDYIGDGQTAQSSGPELLFAWVLQPNVHLLTRGALERRDYNLNNGRQGWYSWGGEYLRILFGTDNHEIMLGGRYTIGDAKRNDYSFTGWETSLNARFKLPLQCEFSPFIAYRQEIYNGPATALELKKRDDEQIRTGAALTWNISESLAAECMWQYTKNNSSSPIYQYDQQLVTTGLSWKF